MRNRRRRNDDIQEMMLFMCKLKDFHSIQFLQKIRQFQEFCAHKRLTEKMRPSFERKYQTQIHRRRGNFQYLIFFRDNGVKEVSILCIKFVNFKVSRIKTSFFDFQSFAFRPTQTGL